jgi:hypothetical protein
MMILGKMAGGIAIRGRDQIMSADWPTTGAVPVFVDRDDGRELAGYTRVTLTSGVRRLMMTKPGLEGDPEGTMRFVGEAIAFERQTPDGSYLAWLVVRGDPRDMPEF